MSIGLQILLVTALIGGVSIVPAAAPHTEDLSLSARVAQDRDVKTLYDQALAQLQSHRVRTALHLFQQILDEPADTFVGDTATQISVRQAVQRDLRQLSVADRKVYEHDFGLAARQSLQNATAHGRFDELRDVVARYRDTPSGWTALKRLADREFDHGRFRLAAAAYRALIAHPCFDRQGNRSLFARLVIAEVRGGLKVSGTFSKTIPSKKLKKVPDTFNPNPVPTWYRETPPSTEVTSLIDAIQKELEDQGISPIVSVTPLTIGPVIAIRTLDGLVARDAASGRLLWQQHLENLWHKDPKRLLNSAWRRRVTEELEQRIYADTLLGRLSSDGKRLFAIERPAQDHRNPTNRLIAYDLRTGEPLWQIDTVPFGINEAASKLFFMGTPCAIDGTLYQLVQSGHEIRLLALRAEDGRLNWWLHLATAPIGLSRDPLRRVTASRVVFQDGILICPTSAGMVVAVDCLTRRILWAYRYGRDDIHRAHSTSPAQIDGPVRFRWWNTWRETKVLVDTENVVVASRESRDLHVLDLKTGRLHWKRPGTRGADLAGLFGSTIVLIESSQVVTLDVANGTIESNGLAQPLSHSRIVNVHRSGSGSFFGGYLRVLYGTSSPKNVPDPLSLPQKVRLPRERLPRIEPNGNVPRPRTAASVEKLLLDDQSEQFFVVPVDATPGELFDRLSVLVERGGRTVQFPRDGQSDARKLPLPDSDSPFRPLDSLWRGWGIQQQLVLQVGTELFGIRPYDADGGTRPRLLWNVKIYSGNTFAERTFEPARLGLTIPQPVFRDRFDQEIGIVGPVTRDYLCYRDKSRLIAISSATGNRLWQRSGLPPGTRATGDAERVLLYHPNSPDVEIVRASDGQTMGHRHLHWLPRDAIFRTGIQWTIATPAGNRSQDRYTLQELDVMTGETVWERNFSSAAVPFAIDSETMGLLEPQQHTLHILVRRTGATRAVHSVDIPQPLNGVYCMLDDKRAFLALSGQISDLKLLRTNPPRQGYRTPLINGSLYAIGRHDGQLLWETSLPNVAFPLDQRKEYPALLLKTYRPCGNYPTTAGKDDVVLQWLDKQTGEDSRSPECGRTMHQR